jgi:hypothetical protein
VPPAAQQFADRLVDGQAQGTQFIDGRVVFQLVGEEQMGGRIEDVAGELW